MTDLPIVPKRPMKLLIGSMRVKGAPPLPPLPPLPNGGPPPVPPRPDGLMLAIRQGTILSITPLAQGHPVFQLTFKNGSVLVVKGERFQDSDSLSGNVKPFSKPNAGQVSGIMGVVSKGVKNNALTDQEIAALEHFQNKPQELIDELKIVKGGGEFLVKMPFTTGIKTFGAAQARNISLADTQSVTQLASGLLGNTEAWKSLGEIFAADLFVGNIDRVGWDRDLSEVKVINPGNLIFQKGPDGKILRAVGLDAFDPTAGDAGRMYGTNIDQWKEQFGELLKRQSNYGRLCSRIVDSMNKWIKMAGSGVAFGHAEGHNLTLGMDSGYRKLQTKIGGDIKAGRKTASGVVARAVFLGWG